MSDITMKIDGREVKGRKGQTVLEVCKDNGVKLPTLCHWPGLTNVGACRLCIVEIEGSNKLGTSCAMPATDGLAIRTDSPALHKRRKMVLELLFSERNHFCPACPSSGNCELQKLGYQFGIDSVRFPYLYPSLPLDVSHKHISMDPNRCVLCQRCVRVCSEKVGANTLDFRQRGIQQMISPDAGMPLGKSSCLSCGACMQVCPTGAITPKDSAYLERATAVNNRRDELKTISSTCAGCSVGCRTLVRVFEDRLLSIDADMEAGDAGTLCEGGRFLKLKDNRPRITRPMVRRDGKLQETDWKTALAYVAERMQKSVREFGAGSVAGIASPSQPNETLYLFQKMMRAGVGTGNVDAIGGNAVRMARAATESLVGENVRAKVEASISDLDKADLFVVIGADPVKTNPVIGAAVIRGFFNRQAKLVVINQDETRLGEIADLNLSPRAGSEGFLINGMMRAMLSEKMLAENTIAEKENFAAALEQYTPFTVTLETRIENKALTEAARLFAEAKNPVILYGAGITQQNDPRLIAALQSLTVLTGHATAEGFPILGMRRSASSTGAFDLGVDPTRLPGRQPLTRANAERFAVAWGKPLPEATAFNADAIDAEQIHAAYLLVGDDTLPEAEKLTAQLDGVNFVVVQAARASKLTEQADVVLPTLTWAEQSGTFTNIEGRVNPLRQAIPAAEGVPDSWQTLCELGKAFGMDASYQSVEEIHHEIAGLVPEYREVLSNGEGRVFFNGVAFDIRRAGLRAPNFSSKVEA